MVTLPLISAYYFGEVTLSIYLHFVAVKNFVVWQKGLYHLRTVSLAFRQIVACLYCMQMQVHQGLRQNYDGIEL